MEEAQFYLAAFTLLEDPKSTQRNFLVPVSLCPRTRAGAKIPGQTPLLWDVPGQNELKIFKKITRLPVFGHHFPVLEHPFPVLEQCFLF